VNVKVPRTRKTSNIGRGSQVKGVGHTDKTGGSKSNDTASELAKNHGGKRGTLGGKKGVAG